MCGVSRRRRWRVGELIERGGEVFGWRIRPTTILFVIEFFMSVTALLLCCV